MIHPGVVSAPRILAYGDSDHPARPAIDAALDVTAFKSTHDIGVVRLSASVLVVIVMEREEQVVAFEEGCHCFVQAWVHRVCVPSLVLRTWRRLRLGLLVRHNGDDIGKKRV